MVISNRTYTITIRPVAARLVVVVASIISELQPTHPQVSSMRLNRRYSQVQA